MAEKDTVKCTILRDVWDANGERQVAGTIVELPAAQAMDMVEAGIVSRVKEPKA